MRERGIDLPCIEVMAKLDDNPVLGEKMALSVGQLLEAGELLRAGTGGLLGVRPWGKGGRYRLQARGCRRRDGGSLSSSIRFCAKCPG